MTIFNPPGLEVYTSASRDPFYPSHLYNVVLDIRDCHFDLHKAGIIFVRHSEVIPKEFRPIIIWRNGEVLVVKGYDGLTYEKGRYCS